MGKLSRGFLLAALAFCARAALAGKTVMVDSNGAVVNPPRQTFLDANDFATKTWADERFQPSGDSEISVGFGLKGSGSSTNPVAVDPDVLPNGLDGIGFGLEGDGSGTNPLAVDPDVVVTTEDRLIESFLAWDGSGFVSQYGPRMPVDAFAAVSAHGAGAPMTFRPGALLDMSIAVDGARHVYVCTQEFGTAVFATNDFTWLPTGEADEFWDVFARQGRTGITGATGTRGTDGLDGVGDFRYGIWDPMKGYVYSTATPIVVSYAGRWYDCVASSTGVPPNSAGATNWWRVSVSNGADGVVVVWTNVVDRGDWDSGATYATNDAVWYQGNRFVVSPTNQVPGVGVPPAVDGDLIGVDSAFWHVLMKRGRRGLQGVPGDLINSYTVYSLLGPTNTLFVNSPSATNRTPRWLSTGGGVLSMEWTPFAWIGTNAVSTDGTNLFLNGVMLESGVDEETFAATMARMASAYRTFWPAGVSGTAVTLRPESNRLWRLETAAENVETWNLAVPGRATNEAATVGLEVYRAQSNMWAWPPGLTNPPPRVGETNLFMLHLPVGGDKWQLYR